MRLAGPAALAVVILASGAAGLAHAERTPIPGRDYVFTVRDDPQGRQFVLDFEAVGRRGLCLLPEHWPNAGGKIDQARDYVRVEIDGRRYPIQDFNTGYCPGGCSVRVAAGKHVEAKLAYVEFDLPEEAAGQHKTLVLDPRPFFCRKER